MNYFMARFMMSNGPAVFGGNFTSDEQVQIRKLYNEKQKKDREAELRNKNSILYYFKS